MARIRTIKPEFPQSESMGRVSRDSRLLFVMLWTIADDAGRARANSRMLASLLFPYDDDAPRLIHEWMFELEREGCIKLYTVDGNAYLQIEKWLTHQKIDRPSDSRIPQYSREFAKPREASSTDLVPGPVPRTKELMSDKSDPRVRSPKKFSEDFEQFWKAYPTDKLMSKAKAGAYWPKLSPEDRALAIAAIPGFREHCRKNPTYRAVHAVRFLSERRFEGFKSAEVLDPEKVAEQRDRVDQMLRRGKYAPESEEAA